MLEEFRIYKDCRGNTTGALWEVSNLGNVKKNGVLIDFIKTRTYLDCGAGRIHRMVAEVFIPNPENKHCVDHIDGNKHNNRVDNLRWVSHSENMRNPNTYTNWKEHIPDRHGENNPMHGKKHSEKTKELIRQKATGRPGPNLGRIFSEEWRANMSKGRKI